MAIVQSNYTYSTKTNTATENNSYTVNWNPGTSLSYSFDTLGTSVSTATDSFKTLEKSLKEIKDKIDKKEKQFDIKLTKQPMPDDIIVINFHSKEIDIDEANQILEQTKKDFPYNQVIGKLDSYDIYRTPCIEVVG